jgi:hypothetical protein
MTMAWLNFQPPKKKKKSVDCYSIVQLFLTTALIDQFPFPLPKQKNSAKRNYLWCFFQIRE